MHRVVTPKVDLTKLIEVNWQIKSIYDIIFESILTLQYFYTSAYNFSQQCSFVGMVP